jgi:hypothetical protein
VRSILSATNLGQTLARMGWSEWGEGRNNVGRFLRRCTLKSLPAIAEFHLLADSLYQLRANGRVIGFGLHSLAKPRRRTHKIFRRLYLALAAVLVLSPSQAGAQNYGPNVLPVGNFENVLPTYVPWAGVDAAGNIHGLNGQQIAVGDDGSIRLYNFGPSIASADLNGDGKLDLVVADTKGFFWFYPNSGSPQKPAFTQGEVIPIWLGELRTEWGTEGVDNVVSRIQVLDLDNSKRLQIIAGTYAGKLFHVPNVGTSASPNFEPTLDPSQLIINTHKKGVLWCNYLAPFLTPAFGDGIVCDLIMGEGTYSANSIYLLHNIGGAGGIPAFDEDHLQKIIPGMGLEQLTPTVVDWNNDGKPDIICGDRTGFISLFLNNSSDPSRPTFAPGVHISVGGLQKLGGSITVSIADLTGNHLPNLLIGKDDGTILYATNTGTLGSPAFATAATPLKGVLPPTYHYVSLINWTKGQAFGIPDELVGAVNPQLDPGFTFPAGEKSKYALKFWVWPMTNTYFPERYYPKEDSELTEHQIVCNQHFNVDLNKNYRVHFWMKSDKTISDLHYILAPDGATRLGFQGNAVKNNIECGSSWTEVTSEFQIRNPDDPTVKTWGYRFSIAFKGQPTFYIDDLTIEAEN